MREIVNILYNNEVYCVGAISFIHLSNVITSYRATEASSDPLRAIRKRIDSFEEYFVDKR